MSIVLVTGGAGFIGSHLVQELVARGEQVRVLDSLSPQVHGGNLSVLPFAEDRRVELVHRSILDVDDWAPILRDVDRVVHLAAETGTGQSMYQIAWYNAANSQGTAILMEALSRHAPQVRRVVLASSRSVYGEGAFACSGCGADPVYPAPRAAEALAKRDWEPKCPRCGTHLHAVPTGEDAPIRPASVYAATKAAQEDLVRIVAQASGIDWVALRFQNVFGERQSLENPYTGILSIFSTRIRRGLPLAIFEDGQESRDFIHVSDVVAAVCAALEHPAAVAATLNVGSGVATSVAGVARELCRAFGREVPIQVTGEFRVGDIRHNVADIGRIAAVLGWQPRVSLQEGLDRFARWVATQPLPEDRLDQANQELRARKLMA